VASRGAFMAVSGSLALQAIGPPFPAPLNARGWNGRRRPGVTKLIRP
jgi:hypothetical protein